MFPIGFKVPIYSPAFNAVGGTSPMGYAVMRLNGDHTVTHGLTVYGSWHLVEGKVRITSVGVRDYEQDEACAQEAYEAAVASVIVKE